MLKKLLVALITSAFALSVYAQAPKSDTTKAEPKGQTGTTTEKADPGKGKSKAKAKSEKSADAKGEKKAAKKSSKSTKDDAKDSRKNATKKDAKKTDAATK